MIILGIDTARGWALVEVSGRTKRVITAGTVPGVEQMIEKIHELSSDTDISVVLIEKSTSTHIFERPGTSPAVMRKIAFNVGQNIEKAESIYRYCKSLGLKAQFVVPLKGGTKLSPEQLKRITGYSGRTSNHARDAIMVAFTY